MSDVLTVGDIGHDVLAEFFGRFDLELIVQSTDEVMTGSFWGDSEAGIVGQTVFVRPDTPVHSLLHESSHVICMDGDRRSRLDRDAGGDDLEESAVCYLQIILADHIAGVGRERIMADMDAWGYSFRLGSSKAWFQQDAEDALVWLQHYGLVDNSGQPAWKLRQ